MRQDREAVVLALKAKLNEEWSQARQQWEALALSLTKETKSTAGDKHETARAMVQLDMEQAGQRVARFEDMVSALERMNPSQARNQVAPGAVVWTDGGGLFIGIPLGVFEVAGNRFQAISSQAPLALALVGAKPTDQVVFRGKTWTVKGIG